LYLVKQDSQEDQPQANGTYLSKNYNLYIYLSDMDYITLASSTSTGPLQQVNLTPG